MIVFVIRYNDNNCSDSREEVEEKKKSKLLLPKQNIMLSQLGACVTNKW